MKKKPLKFTRPTPKTIAPAGHYRLLVLGTALAVVWIAETEAPVPHAAGDRS